MKKIVFIIMSLVLVVTLAACEDAPCVGVECVGGAGGTEPVMEFDHLNGHGVVTPRNAYILFEYEQRDFVKYQVTYLSCTCRSADLNYWQVAYVEVEKSSNKIIAITFGEDGEGGHYTAGMWGDSSPTPAGKTLEDFENEFIPWLIGKTSADLDGISLFKTGDYHGIENTTTLPDTTYTYTDGDGATQTGDLVDAYTGSSVSTNNMIRVMKELLTYHESNY